MVKLREMYRKNNVSNFLFENILEYSKSQAEYVAAKLKTDTSFLDSLNIKGEIKFI